MIESINRVELLGRCGSVKRLETATGQFVKITLVTTRVYKDRDGNMMNEQTWHCVIIPPDCRAENLDKLKAHAIVHVHGRIRLSKYTLADGSERTFQEIVADDVKVYSDEQQD